MVGFVGDLKPVGDNLVRIISALSKIEKKEQTYKLIFKDLGFSLPTLSRAEFELSFP